MTSIMLLTYEVLSRVSVVEVEVFDRRCTKHDLETDTYFIHILKIV